MIAAAPTPQATSARSTRKGGAVFYAKLKLAGRLASRSAGSGKVWTKRSRPPAGYLTRGAGRGAAAGDPRGRRPARERRAVARHVRAGVRRAPALPRARPAAQAVLPQGLPRASSAATCCPRSASRTPVEEITTGDVDALRETLLARGARAQDRAEGARAARRHPRAARSARGGSRSNPCDDAEKVIVKRSDEFNVPRRRAGPRRRARRGR